MAGGTGAIALWGLILWGASWSDGSEANELAEQFAESLEEARTHLMRKRWEKAEAALLEAIGAHDREPFVLARRFELLELLELSRFFDVYEAPDEDELIEGELKRWRESSGDVELRYQEGLGGDWIGAGRVFGKLKLHPIVFYGPHTVRMEVKPSGFGSTTSGLAVGIRSGSEPYYVAYGRYGGGLYRLGERQETLGTWKSKGAVELEVDVGSKSIAVRVDGKKVASAKTKEPISGNVALSGLGSPLWIELRGKAYGSWFQGLRDAHLFDELERFRKRHSRTNSLPAWLAGERDEPLSLAWEELPGSTAEGVREELWDEAQKYIRRGASSGGLEWARTLLADAVDDNFRAALELELAQHAGDWSALSSAVQRLREVLPDDPFLRFQKARAAAYGGDLEAGIDLLEQLVEATPTVSPAWSELAKLQFWGGAPDASRATLERAMAAGVHPANLEEPQQILTRSDHGPFWHKANESKTTHYLVRTDLDEQIAWEIAQELEDAYKKYSRALGRVGGDDKRASRSTCSQGSRATRSTGRD